LAAGAVTTFIAANGSSSINMNKPFNLKKVNSKTLRLCSAISESCAFLAKFFLLLVAPLRWISVSAFQRFSFSVFQFFSFSAFFAPVSKKHN
jgi:hypothetical protein